MPNSLPFRMGMRIRDCLKDSRPLFPQQGSVISMPLLVCFGQHDIDMFEKYGHGDRIHIIPRAH